MSKAHIYIRIQPRENSLQDAQEWKIDLDPPLIAELMEPLAKFTPPTGPPEKYFMSKSNSVIVGHRKGVARRLANMFTEKIIHTFESNDTIQGYSRKEWEDIHGPEQVVTPSQLYYVAKIYPEILDENDTEEYDKLEDKSYWEAAARTINKIIKNKEKL